MKENIIIIGMPGSGKSTVGPLLAKMLNKRCVDIDAMMAPDKKALQNIVDEMGMQAFLAFEEETLLTVDRGGDGKIIITGGSAVFGEKAMRYHGENGLFLYLDAPLGTLERRVNFECGGLAKTEEQSLADVFAQRSPYYKKFTDITIQIADKSPEQIAREAAEAIAEYSDRRDEA